MLVLGAVSLIGCADAMKVEPGLAGTAGSDRGTASLSLQAVPDDVSEVALSVTGPGMDPLERTITPETDGLYLEVPPGEDRTFRAEAGDRTAEQTLDVPPSGISVTLPLEFENTIQLGDKSFQVGDFVVQEVGPAQTGTGREFGFLVLSDSFETDSSTGAISGSGDLLQLSVIIGTDSELPPSDEYAYPGTEQDPALGDLAYGIVAFDQTYQGGDLQPNSFVNGGTTTLSVAQGSYDASLDLTTQNVETQDEQELIGSFSGEPAFVVPASANEVTGQFRCSPARGDLTWSDRSKLETSYRVLRSDDGGETYNVRASDLPADKQSYSDEYSPQVGFGTFYYRVLSCKDGVCTPASSEATVTYEGC